MSYALLQINKEPFHFDYEERQKLYKRHCFGFNEKKKPYIIRKEGESNIHVFNICCNEMGNLVKKKGVKNKRSKKNKKKQID